jgi:ubiquinone/menaquinone biosynthesis C-methylase UbiE
MSTARQQVFAAPFDAVAARYDETFTLSRIGQAQRAAAWHQLAKAFLAGDRTLEIGCGTGIDACFLAKRGVKVVACDPSSQMIEMATRRIQQSGLEGLVQPRQVGAENLASLWSSEKFDGAFSNFGALNCVDDLRKLAIDLARLLKPGATVFLCWMGPYCLWEMIWYTAQGKRDKAFRRFKQEGISARLANDAFVHVRYPSVGSLARAFSPEFRMKAVRGIGVAVPPSYLEPWARRHPQLLQMCEQFDSWMGSCPGIRSLGDHVLVRLQREKTVAAEIEE